MKRTLLATALTLLPLAACVDGADLASTEQAGTVYDGNGDSCPKWGCSSNSAYLGPSEFHELDETGGTPNKEGFRITSFTKNGVSYRVNVTGTTLVGQQYLWGQGWVNTLTDQNLVGAELNVDSANGTRYAIKIYAVSNVQKFWQGPAGTVNTYELQWRQVYPASTHYTPVCKDPPSRIDGEDKAWLKVSEAILFTGDRYDVDTLTVTATGPRAAGPWFNIGCAGTVLAKLALNRFTDATAVPGAVTTWAQRQSMLKMYTSDVCGHGDALTKVGTALRWWSSNGWASSPIAVNSHEAYWNENGAICLDTHRLHGTLDDMDLQIAASCAAAGKPLPPPCAPGTSSWYMRTASPAIP